MTRIFISYKRESQPFAEDLRQRLLGWGYEVWMDIYDIPKGAHWPDEIQKGLESCDVVLGLMTSPAMDSRNVKNEWDWAIVYNKRFIPLLVETCIVQMNYVSLNYIDFTKSHNAGFTALQNALKLPPSTATISTDPYREYLQKLYERINDYLARAIITRTERDEAEPIRLVSERSAGMVDALFEKRDEVDPLFSIGFGDTPENTFSDFNKAFEQFDGRVLLLGEPGAGKTITLLHFGRDAIVRRMQDTKQPLPILATIPTWDIRSTPPLLDWLSTSYGAPENTADIIHQGKALLLLDGLDELGGEREDPQTKERILDPRPRFMDALRALPESNQVIVTCRVKDYEEIGPKIALKGALTLKPLSDTQIHDYLHDLPELWSALESDEQLRDVTRTPILLSYFAFGYKEASIEERQRVRDLRSSLGDLRDAIFERYVKGRYNHEKAKQNANLPYDLETIYRVLGEGAKEDITRWTKEENTFRHYYFWDFLGQEHQYNSFIEEVCRLNILVVRKSSELQFIHLMLRDHFALKSLISTLLESISSGVSIEYKAIEFLAKLRSIRLIEPFISVLKDEQKFDRSIRIKAIEGLTHMGGNRVVDALIVALDDDDEIVRYAVGKALAQLKDVRAVEPLIRCLDDEDAYMRSEVAEALGRIGDNRATEALINHLYDDESRVPWKVIEALGRIGDPHAIEPLIEALKYVGSKLHDNLDESIVESLVKFGEQATEPLNKHLFDTNWRTNWGVTKALGEIGDPRAIQSLIAALCQRDNLYLKSMAPSALWRFGKLTIKPLMKALNHDNYFVQESVAEVLGTIGEWEPEALIILTKWRHDIKTNPLKRIKRLWQYLRSSYEFDRAYKKRNSK